MSDGKLALQAALYTKVAAAVSPAGVFDILAPETAPFPRVTIGELISTPDDTKTERGTDVVVSFHAWSRTRSSAEAKGLLDKIYDALHLQPLTVPQFSVTWCRKEIDQSMMDADGTTHHALAQYRIRIEPA